MFIVLVIVYNKINLQINLKKNKSNNTEFILSVMHKLKQSFDRNISLRKGLSFDFFRKVIF
jgi:hypothetical protein